METLSRACTAVVSTCARSLPHCSMARPTALASLHRHTRYQPIGTRWAPPRRPSGLTQRQSQRSIKRACAYTCVRVPARRPCPRGVPSPHLCSHDECHRDAVHESLIAAARSCCVPLRPPRWRSRVARGSPSPPPRAACGEGKGIDTAGGGSDLGDRPASAHGHAGRRPG
jgi:hypothetical protein